jgi:NAD(P)-dependent dehydrogenase (short-subunit alcohol dehydrogenase family)
MAECEGKVALVTGGTSGIGRETSILFARKGARVVVAGRREIEGKETIDLIRRAGGEGIFVRTDVSRASDVEALVEKTVAAFGGLDYAFNNAGIEGHWVPIVEQTEEEWDQTIDINLKGTWLCLKYEIRQMLQQGRGGAIVNNSSIAGFIGSRGTAIYSASKHGVLGLTKAAAIELGRNGIRVNAVCPAAIRQQGIRKLGGEFTDARIAIRRIPRIRHVIPRRAHRVDREHIRVVQTGRHRIVTKHTARHAVVCIGSLSAINEELTAAQSHRPRREARRCNRLRIVASINQNIRGTDRTSAENQDAAAGRNDRCRAAAALDERGNEAPARSAFGAGAAQLTDRA